MKYSPSDEEVARDSAHTGNASSARDYSYSLVDVAAGPRVLPDWLRAANIRWNFGWSNRPELEFCFSRNPLAGVTYIKQRDGTGMWFGSNLESDCFKIHWHKGAVSEQEFERNLGWDTPNGKYAPGAAMLKEPYSMLATTQQEGYAGRHFDLQMSNISPCFPGEIVRLRGPWHGGYLDWMRPVVGVVWDEKAREREAQAALRFRRGWVGATKCFGYLIREQTFVDALATFFPHCPIARVTSGPDRNGKARTWIEPCLPQTQAPRFMTEAQRIDGAPLERAAA